MRTLTLAATALATLAIAGCTTEPGVRPVAPEALPTVGEGTSVKPTVAARPSTAVSAPVELRVVTQATFTCRALDGAEDIQIRDLALGLVSAAAVDVTESVHLALVAENRDDLGVQMFLFDKNSPRLAMAKVSDQWNGVGFDVRLVHYAEAMAQVKACAMSPDAPTKR